MVCVCMFVFMYVCMDGWMDVFFLRKNQRDFLGIASDVIHSDSLTSPHVI